MSINQGWWEAARCVPSPNRDVRPEHEVSLLVLHAICLPPGQFGGEDIERLFTNDLDPDAHPYFAAIANLRVSAHLLIRRNGEGVQFVSFDARAWHAGRSRWCDDGWPRSALNDFSIGIELEGDENTPYTAAQYRALTDVTLRLIEHYPDLNERRITSHARVAPLRKIDPGPTFDWAYFRQLLRRRSIEAKRQE